MKNKSTRHKDVNTFKFLPFSERISNINIDIFHKVKHEYETQSDEVQSHFYQAVQKWNVLNLTEGYDRFKREIKAENYITLPQLLLAKDHIVKILLKHLNEKNPLYLQPVLEIVVAVAQDLQKDFYPYYFQFLETLIKLLNTKYTEQLEWVFTSLAYIFKFLWRPIIKNINEVFISLLPLLSDGKPEYINAFAAESFAFVARKVKDKEAFLDLLIKNVHKRKDGISGCGKLLFEVIKGVDGQFHSCAEHFLPFFFESLSNIAYSQTVLFEILEQLISNVAFNIHPQKCNLLWEVLLKILSNLEENLKNDRDDKTIKNIELILKLVGQICEYRGGKFVQNPYCLIQQLIKFLNMSELPENVLIIVIQIAVSMLLLQNVRLPQEQASQIIRKIVALDNENLLLYFVDTASDCSSFEMLILPSFLRRFCNFQSSTDALHILTKLIFKKAPIHLNGINFDQWTKYPLDFKEHNKEVYQKLSQILDVKDYESIVNNFEELFCTLICLPHLVLKEDEEQNVLQKIEDLIDIVLKKIPSCEETKNLRVVLFILNVLLKSAGHLKGDFILEKKFSKIFDTLLPYAANENCLGALNSLSLLFSVLRDTSAVTLDNLSKINGICAINFSNPYHEIRILTAHIYTFFESLPEFKLKHSEDPDVPPESWKVFSLILQVESMDPQVDTYRDQLQRLEKLSFDKPQMIMCQETEFKDVPLRYLCGVLYMNFRLLWEPVCKILASHAAGLDSNTFWTVFGTELKGVVENIKMRKELIADTMETQLDVLNDLFKQSQYTSVKPDFINYRLLLWKCLGLFADVAETKTRDVAELFLNFINNEYNNTNAELATICNIKQYSLKDAEEYNIDEKEDAKIEEYNSNEKADTKIEENNKKGDNKEQNEKKIVDAKVDNKIVVNNMGRKITIKTLLHKLSVFSQFKSPKSMYREPELYRLYFDLLKHKNPDIQKAALDCIMTYKFKYLIPYKEHIYNLIDDKKFKNEITSFSVDKDSTEVLTEHRNDLVPVILQVVFSKMSAKTGLRTGGKASSQNRRALILRFLAGCEEQEMLIFIEKAFAIYSKFLKDNDVDLANAVADNVDLEKCLAPKKLLSTINLLNVILEQFGGLMGDKLLTYLIKILLVVGSTIKGIFVRSSEVHSGYSAILRNLRTSAVRTLERFFEQFDKYPWTGTQLDAIFLTFVWPYLEKLNIEGIHSPTSLLKLFKQWGSNPRYFCLLVKHKENDCSQYILPKVFELLVNEKSNISVINTIYDMVETLLKYEMSDEEKDAALQVDNVLPVEQSILDRIKVNDKLNYGSCILLPHIPLLLERIKRKLQGRNKILTQQELFILSRVSELVWESDISDKVLQLVLPIVLKKCSGDEQVVIQLFTTIYNLIKNVNTPDVHLRSLIPLFGEVPYPSCRKLLVKTLNYVAEKEESEILKNAAVLISELNAFDAKWLDQPDFEKRHNAFKTIQREIDNDSIDLTLGLLLVYNCYYLLKNEKDLSLRDSSSHTLKKLCPYLVKKHQNQKDFEFLLNDCIFVVIKRGMRSLNNPDFRNECISLLGHLARDCPSEHFVLRDLNKFTNKSDLEVDFFENLTHLQTHRHARAMTRFCQMVRQETVAPNPKTVTQFLLPLASSYLCTDKYVGKNSVIDAAIEMIGVICRILPWHQYEGMLKYCLSQLRYKTEYKKQLVRLTVAILDAFHFDLSKGHADKVEIVKNLDDNVLEDKKDNCVKKINDNVQDEVVADEVDDKIEANNRNNEQIDDGDMLDALEQTYEAKEDEEEEDNQGSKEEQKIIDKISVLCKSTATRVIKTIQVVLLPQLHKSLAELTHYESSHKINRKRTGIEREEEDLARVPISLAVVKLLQRLPKNILDSNLPGVFLKLCSFLKSHLESVRRVARETLQKIMQTLGPKYLKLLLGEMAPLLNRGFQVHVLVFTVHGVLSCLKGSYEPGDLDNVLLTVLNLCTADLFGVLSEEKEVVKLTVKVSEAKSTKSHDTLQILAQNVTESCLMDILLPIKRVLESSHSLKVVQKAQDALRHIALGMVDNTFLSTESLLKFAYGTSAQKIPELMPSKKKKITEDKIKDVRDKKEDCFIIPKIPGNRTVYREVNVKTSSNINAYVLVEFGLRLCFTMLKRERVKDEEYRPFIDPFVQIFRDCLKSKHVKLCTVTLQCLQWTLKYELPSMQKQIKWVAKDIFSILHKYASAGLTKGDNFDLVVAAFKTMAVLVRDVQYYTVDKNQLKVLLLYVEQDVHNYDRQATAFSLLKAIITRKLIVPEIHDVMAKVAELSITSELNHVRSQARLVFHQFLMEYPLGNTLEKHLGFYLSQMSFDMQYGRESALEMIQSLINSFPLNVLKNQSGTLLITLGARLVNDDVPECKKMAADCISSMLKRLPKTDRDPLFEILTLWLKDKEISHRQLAAQVCGIMVSVEKNDFETRLPIVVPLILKQFGLTDQTPGRFVKIKKEKNTTEEYERMRDHHHFQVLQLVLKLCALCPAFLKRKDSVEHLAYHAQTLLAYPHEWVRLAAAQFLGFVLSSIDVENLATMLANGNTGDGYLFLEPESCVKSLALDLCDQLQTNVQNELAEQVIKNLVFVARVLEKVSNDYSEKKVNLLWLTKRMRKVVNTEVTENASSSVLRTEVFKWIAGVITVLKQDSVKPILHHLLAPLVREMITTDEKNAPLRQLAKEVAGHLKSKIGLEEYSEALRRLQQNLTVKRSERKRSRAQLAVTDPEAFAKKKIKKHEKKKVLRKRKMEELRGKKSFKRRKVVDLEDNSEVM